MLQKVTDKKELFFGIFNQLVFILCFSFSFNLWAQDLQTGVILPTFKRPAVVDAGKTITIITNLRLALTPPPGVQQPRAWSGWKISLKAKADASIGQTDKNMTYNARLVRIRPGKEKRQYEITVIVNPWIPSGVYDLEIIGPGFSKTEKNAVIIGSNIQTTNNLKIEQKDFKIINIHNHSKHNDFEGFINIKISQEIKAINVFVNNTKIVPYLVTWSGDSEFIQKNKARLARYKIKVKAATDNKSGVVKLVIKQAKNSKQNKTDESKIFVRFIGGEKKLKPLNWHTLELLSAFKPKGILWDFKDGEFAAGKKVNHRWLFSDRATALAYAFDDETRLFEVPVSAKLILPMSPIGCSCDNVGSSCDNVGSWFNSDAAKRRFSLFDLFEYIDFYQMLLRE